MTQHAEQGVKWGEYDSKVPQEKGGNESLSVGRYGTSREHGAVVLVVADAEGEGKENEETDC